MIPGAAEGSHSQRFAASTRSFICSTQFGTTRKKDAVFRPMLWR